MRNDSIPLGKKLAQIRESLDTLLDKGNFGSKWQSLYEEEQRIENIIVERNLKGQQLEKQGDIEGVIRIYEQNILDEVETPHPYKRLAVIYRRQKRFDDEIRVLEKAIKIFKEIEQNKKWEEQLIKAKQKQKE